MTVSPTTLKNKGVPVDVYVVERTEDEDGTTRYEYATEKGGARRTEKLFIQVDMNLMADVEEHWGDTVTFQEAMQLQQTLTTTKLFGMLLGVDRRLAGKMLIPERASQYATAVGVALSIANGVDPTRAAKVMEIGVKAQKEAEVARDKAIDEVLTKSLAAPSTGTGTSENGSEPADLTASSGD